MLKINFYPDSNRENFSEELNNYRKIWKEEGAKVVESIEKISRLKFKETTINAIVFRSSLPPAPTLYL